jgi:hypothetical protein
VSYNLDPSLPLVGPIVDQMLDAARSVCLVGWREFRDGDTLSVLIQRKIPVIHVVDAWSQNVAHLMRWLGTDHPNVYPLVRDVREYLQEPQPTPLDVLIWQHGPEHLEKKEARALLSQAQQVLWGILLEVPDGPYPQGPIFGNPHEIHRSTWYFHDLRDLGFVSVGSPEGDHLISIWQREE